MARHNCGLGYSSGWPHCCICDGRVHEDGCTSKRNKEKDCCPARHKMLYDQGKVRGIYDDSQAMWSKEFPQGFHDPLVTDHLRVLIANAGSLRREAFKMKIKPIQIGPEDRDPRREPKKGDVVMAELATKEVGKHPTGFMNVRRVVTDRIAHAVLYRARGNAHTIHINIWRDWCSKFDAVVLKKVD